MSKHSKRVPRLPTGMHSSIPAEIGRAEDGVKEAFEKSKEKISKNAKDFQTQVKQRTKGAKKSVRKSLSKGIKKVKGFKNGIWDGTLLKFSELPEWMQDNEFITALHRPELNNALVNPIFKRIISSGNDSPPLVYVIPLRFKKTGRLMYGGVRVTSGYTKEFLTSPRFFRS